MDVTNNYQRGSKDWYNQPKKYRTIILAGVDSCLSWHGFQWFHISNRAALLRVCTRPYPKLSQDATSVYLLDHLLIQSIDAPGPTHQAVVLMAQKDLPFWKHYGNCGDQGQVGSTCISSAYQSSWLMLMQTLDNKVTLYRDIPVLTPTLDDKSQAISMATLVAV